MTVTALNNNNDLTNIPHMLRNLAAELERGDEPMPQTMLVVAVHGANAVPTLYHFGTNDHVLLDAAALNVTAQRMTQVMVDEG